MSSRSPSAMTRPLLPLTQFPESFRRFLSPEAPEAVAVMVARAMVPMPPVIKVCALYQVAHLHPTLAQQANHSLLSIPEEISRTVYATELPPMILDWIADVLMQAGAVDRMMWVLNHPKFPPQSALRIISSASVAVCERIGADQALLNRAPYLLQALCLAPQTPKVLKDKLIEWAHYMKIPLQLPQSPSPQVQMNQPQMNQPQMNQPQTVQPHTAPSPSSQLDSPSLKEASVTKLQPHDQTTPASSAQAQPLKIVHPPVSYSELGVPQIPSLTRSPLRLDDLSPVVARFLAPEAPEQAVRMLISGMVPMPPTLRILSLYHLSVTRPTVADLITSATRQLDTTALLEAIRTAPSEGLIDWISELRAQDEEILGELITHPCCSALTLAKLALSASEALVERIALNQIRWLEAPVIFQALYFNPQLRASTSDRLIELAARQKLDLSWLPESEALIESLTGQVATPIPIDHDQLFSQALEEGRLRTPEQTLVETIKADQIERGDSHEQEVTQKKTGYSAIMMMNVSQKIRLALLGSQSDRALLVKDSNKVVARAAIRSPSVSVSEALMYARNTSLAAPIIEYIATNKKWMQNYPLRAQIVMNPKTPTHIALQALNSLRPPELKAISQSHNVPAVVSQRAKALIKGRQG